MSLQENQKHFESHVDSTSWVLMKMYNLQIFLKCCRVEQTLIVSVAGTTEYCVTEEETWKKILAGFDH